MTDSTVAKAEARSVRKRGVVWIHRTVIIFCLGLLVWYASRLEWSSVLSSVSRAKLWFVAATVPLVLVNMMLRAFRWRTLLGSRREAPFRSVFSAQMIGYLANNVLPVRAGDLVRVYALGNAVDISRSRILSTVVLERLLDMGMVVFLLIVVTAFGPLPDWISIGGTGAGISTVLALAVLLAVSATRRETAERIVDRVPAISPAIKDRMKFWMSEFSSGFSGIRDPRIAALFFGATIVIWATEMMLVLLVGKAFLIPLGFVDAAILMLFSLFSSFIPALPGQIGLFELAMVTGLDFAGHAGPSSLPFALTLHAVLLSGTTIIGLVCLVASGWSIGFVRRLAEGKPL